MENIKRKKICIPISTRGNYGKLKSTFNSILENKNLELQIVIGGGLLLDKFGDFKDTIKSDGFEIKDEIPFLLDGDSNELMSISSGLATIEFSRCLRKLKPDIVFIIADRYESLAFAQAALCMNCQIAHLEGGEISGSIDERIRHSITKLAHIHFPSNHASAERIKSMGEDESRIKIVGSPSIDIIKNLNLSNIEYLKNYLDNKIPNFNINLKKPYIVVSQHPVVTEVESSLEQIKSTFNAISDLEIQVVWILPNMDAGQDAARSFLNNKSLKNKMIVINSLHLEAYTILLKNSCCLVGNSSSGIRECAYLGVPSVNIGSRQIGRLRTNNVIDCDHDLKQIREAIIKQIRNGHYISSDIYGNGNSGKLISKFLQDFPSGLNKIINY